MICPDRSVLGTSTLLHDNLTKPSKEDETLLTLYALAGEETGEFITLHPRILHRIRHYLLAMGHTLLPHSTQTVEIRELPIQEMFRAEEELWIHDKHQKVDVNKDRLFGAFAGRQLVGVARCSRYIDGLEVDGVYVLEEYRHQGFARKIMERMIEECGRNETLYLQTKPDLIEFYHDMGFGVTPALPVSIQPRAGTYPMKRDPK